MIITKHGKKRIKERRGLPKRAQNRHILMVLKNGKLISRKGMEKFKMVYQGFIYIFALTNKLEAILVTIYACNSYQSELIQYYNKQKVILL